jgi:hypothetical protein
MSLIKDVRADLAHLPVTEKSIRSFAYVMAGAFFILAMLVFFFGQIRERSFWIAGIAALFLLMFWFLPALLKPLYIFWMLLSFVLGWLMSRLLLTLLFFLVITPIGLVMRLFGKDILQQKTDVQRISYWIKRSPETISAERYEKQF